MSIPSTHFSLLRDIQTDGRQEDAWTAFHSRYHGVILNWCSRRGLPLDEGEDLTQDVMVKLFQQLPKYHHNPDRGQFRGWLKTVVNNAIVDYWRRRQRREESPAIGGTTFLDMAAGLASPEAALELSTEIERHATTSAAEIIERVRAKLKDSTWQAFYLSTVDERPASEIAASLNLSIAAVYKATYRVKQLLLEEHRHAQLSHGGSDSLSESGESRKTSA